MHKNRIYIPKVEFQRHKWRSLNVSWRRSVVSAIVNNSFVSVRLLSLCTLVAMYNIGVLMTHSVTVCPSHTGFKTFTFLVSLKKWEWCGRPKPWRDISEDRTTSAVKGKIHRQTSAFDIWFPINPQKRDNVVKLKLSKGAHILCRRRRILNYKKINSAVNTDWVNNHNTEYLHE